MASFTDQLVAFNPYVQQIPVDDYVRVGMIKQQQYEQGVQKVQGYIDSVAGLEVVKPEQKDYLHQRVSNLQQEAGKVVQSDFSNQQLVNSVGALTSKIASDPIIQTAVASTQAYKQGLASIKEAREKGKSSVSNEWDFHNQFQKWYSDGDATTRFSGTYTPYTDVNKKILDAVKQLAPNSHLEDIPYKRLPGGQIERDETGRPVIDMAMMQKSLEGVSPERIEAAINANITPDDINQLSIDGRYEYRGADAQAMKRITDQRYSYRLNQVNDVIQGLMIQRQAANNNPALASEIDQKIQSYKDRALQMQDSYRSSIGSINTNLEGYKSNFYTNDWSKSFSDAYAYSKESLTYKENPYFMAAERKRENDIKFQEYMMNKYFESAKLGIEEEKLGIERQKLEAYKAALAAKAAGKTAKGALGDIPLSDAVLEPIPQEGLEDVNVSNFLKETNDIGDEIDQEKMALLGNTGLVTIKRDPTGKNPRYEYNVAGKDPNTVIAAANAAVGKLKDAYDKDPNSVDDGTRAYFDKQSNADKVIGDRKYAIGNVGKMADEDGWGVSAIASRIPTLKVNAPGGTGAMTGQQQYDLSVKLAQVVRSEPYVGRVFDDQAASKLLSTPEEKYVYQLMKKQGQGAPLSPEESQIVNKMADVRRTAVIPSLNVVRGRSNYMDNAVKEIVGVQQPVSFTLEAFKGPDRKRAQAVASRLVNTIIAEDKASPNPRYDKSDIESMLGKKSENTTYSLVSKGRGKYALGLSNTEVTGNPVEMDISKQQAEELFGQGKFLDDFYNIRETMQLTKGTAKWSTDVQGLGKDGAFNLRNGNLNKYSVKYHVEDPLKNGGLQVKMYIYDKQNKQWLPDRTASFGQLLDEAQVTKFLSNIGDEYIDSILQTDKK